MSSTFSHQWMNDLVRRYPIDYFIQKFEAIPEDRWTIGQYTDEDGRCCARGHCGAGQLATITDEDRALSIIFWHTSHIDGKSGYLGVSEVNDGTHKLFKQDTPRARVLAALNYLKENQVNG